MTDESALEGKRILIVDDELDILETLEELLDMCDIVKTTRFEEAKDLLETLPLDMAILDIMGVQGYELLKIANEKKIVTVMLTAHALSPEDTVKSFREGAASYVPKDQIAHITSFLVDVIEAEEKGKHLRWHWLKRLGAYYVRKFGPDWKKNDEKFWETFAK